MPVRESQKRASAMYVKRHVKAFNIRFYPKDKALYEYFHKKDKKNQDILDLIAKDMEQQGKE